MKALSIHPEYAMNIIKGLKTVEVRGWTTKYRGDILICATANKGKLSLWECDLETELLPAPEGGRPLQTFCEKFWDTFLRGECVTGKK